MIAIQCQILSKTMGMEITKKTKRFYVKPSWEYYDHAEMPSAFIVVHETKRYTIFFPKFIV